MASSKLSHRRAIAKKPPICIPPPPPVLPWPATTIDLRYVADYYNIFPPLEHVDQTVHLLKTPGVPEWSGSLAYNGDDIAINLMLNSVPQTAALSIHGTQNAEPYTVVNLAVPITWGSLHYYSVTTWPTHSPPNIIASASFWF